MRRGDELILHFSKLIRDTIPEGGFVGRYGGDEFIALLKKPDPAVVRTLLDRMRARVEQENKRGVELPLSYAVGVAYSAEQPDCTMHSLLQEADRKMYLNKKKTKQQTADTDNAIDLVLSQMLTALGRPYHDCYYCNAKTGLYRMIKQSTDTAVPHTGSFTTVMRELADRFISPQDRAEILDKLSIPYAKAHLNIENQNYTVRVRWHDSNRNEHWWRVNVLYIDSDGEDGLFHYMVAFEENTNTVELEHDARYDGLTDLLNRKTAFAEAEKVVEQIPDCYHAMMMLDIDNFKKVNDTQGHQVGDMMLQGIAALLKKVFRKEDIVARFGGDEFVVVLADIKDPKLPGRKAAELARKVSEQLKTPAGQPPVTLSIGITVTDHILPLDEMVREADAALYTAKKRGKNGYAEYEREDTEQAAQRADTPQNKAATP